MDPIDYIKTVKLKYLLDSVIGKYKKHLHCTDAEYNRENSSSVYDREFAIQYINQVADFSKISYLTRDTSIQVFDLFMAESSLQCPERLNSNFASMAAATSIVVAAKFHENATQQLVKLTSFNNLQGLKSFEIELLCRINFDIHHAITPSAFIEVLLSLSPYTGQVYRELYALANELVTQFWERNNSLFYAPHQIAISALFYALQSKKLDVESWLSEIPDSYLSDPDSMEGGERFFQMNPPLFLQLSRGGNDTYKRDTYDMSPTSISAIEDSGRIGSPTVFKAQSLSQSLDSNAMPFSKSGLSTNLERAYDISVSEIECDL